MNKYSACSERQLWIGTLILGSVVLALYCPWVLAEIPKTDFEEQGLVGPVETVVAEDSTFVRTYRYDMQGKLTQMQVMLQPERFPNDALHYVYLYDGRGHRLAATVYGQGKSLVTREIYGYDENGKRTVKASVDADGTLKDVAVQFYEDNQRKQEVLQYVGSSLISRYIYYFDMRGNAITQIIFKDGKPDLKCENSYDSQDHLIESLCYGADGVLYSKGLFTYDDKWNVISQSGYSGDGSLISKVVFAYEYDDHGNWIKRTSEIWHSQEGKLVLRETQSQSRKITYFVAGRTK